MLNDEASLSASMRKKGKKLTNLTYGIEIIRDGNVLSNEQLLKQIRVPDKIHRRFTIARDYDE